MKTIGLIGGMSWESSLDYYRIINETVKEKLGGLHSAECLMYSVDFGIIEKYLQKEEWEKIADRIIEIANNLEKGGAGFILLCTNTMHNLAERIETSINIPLLHIADATADEIIKKGLKKVGLLGTRFTMEMDFYRTRLKNLYNIDVLIPEKEERDFIHKVIFEELCLGQFKPDSKKAYLEIINNLTCRGAEGIILGCTEIPLLIKQDDLEVFLFNTSRIHAISAVEFALKK